MGVSRKTNTQTTIRKPRSWRASFHCSSQPRRRGTGLLRGAIFLGLLLLPISVTTQPPTKYVLILTGGNPNHPGFSLITQSIASTVRSGSPERVEFLFELQPALLEPQSELDDREMAKYLNQKYAGKKIDLILAIATPRFKVILQNDPQLFKDVPKVFYDFQDERDATLAGVGPHVTGVWAVLDLRETLDMAIGLQPDAKKIVVVSGDSPYDRQVLERARNEFRSYESKYQFTYLTNLTILELKAKLAALDRQTIVIMLLFSTDRTGNQYAGGEALAAVAPTSGAPIYGHSDRHLGQGIVGGSLIDFPHIGRRLGTVSLRILSGEKPENIPSETVANTIMFDWRELRRWGISESSLPPGSIVQFKQPTLWEAYKQDVIALVAAVVVEGLLIAMLLITQRRRALAEAESRRLSIQAGIAHKRLGEIVSNVPGIVWESMVDPATNQRKTTFISDHVQKMLGYTPEEWLAQPLGFGARIMHEDDRALALQQSESVIETGRDGFSQFRWRAKDGHLIWTENYLSPIIDSAGKVIGLRGVAIDISDRKSAEETARVTEEKDRAILEAVPDLMFLHSPEGTYLDYHGKDPREFFVPPEQFMSRNIRDVLPQPVAEKILAGIEHVKNRNETYLVEYQLPINGHHRWYEARMVPSAGNILTVVRDITARRQAEESLRRAEEKDRAILEAIPDLMFVQTRDGVYLDHHCTNPGDLLVPPEVFMGKNMHDVLPPALADQFAAAFGRAIETGATQVVEYELPLHDEPRWFEARIVTSGENMVSVIRDITQRVLSAAAIKQSEAQLAGVIGSAMDGIITVDKNQRIVMFNESAERIFGCPAAEAVGQSLDQFIPTRYQQAHRTHVATFGAGPVTRRPMGERGIELFGLKRSGEEFPMEASISQIEVQGQKLYTVILRDITDRKLADAALKESELNYRTIFNAASDAIFLIDIDSGAIVDVNERMCEMYGCTPEQARTLWVADLSSNETPYTEKEAAVFIEKAGTGRPQIFEWRAKKLDGELFWVEVSLRHISLRRKECLLAVVRDITERKRAEDQLAESHRQVTDILESIGDAFYSVDNDLCFTYVNRKTEELWARRRHDLIGRNFLDVFPEAIGTYSHQQCMRARDEARPVNFEAVSPTLNRWVETSVYPTAAGLSIYFRDITERKQAADALRESEGRLRRAQEAAKVGTWEWNIATGESVWSDMIWQLLGIEPEDTNPQVERFIGMIHPEDRDRAWQRVNEVLDHGEVYDDEFRVIRANGEVVWWASKGRVIRSADGRAERMIGVNIDNTERHRALDQLRESQERFRKAFRANPQPMSLTILPTGEYLDVNESFLQMSGYRRDEVIGRTSVELNIWGSTEARTAFVRELKERGSVVNRETKFHVKNGTVRTLLSSAEDLEIDGKQCLLVASSDITERMFAQQALRESEARFRNMADTAPVMIWIADVNKGSTYFNQQWLDFTGRTIEQETGNGWTVGIHPLDLDGCMKMFEAAFDSREPFRMEYRLRRHDGAYRWVIDSGTPRFSLDGEFLGYIGSSVDITDRKESEAALVFAHEALENAYAEVNQLKTQLQEENIYLQEEIKLQQNFGEIVGASDSLKYVLFKIEQVAPTDSTVLITGETGTGKELVARAIHTASTRRDRPLVKVNCAALSASLIESELFGHEKGAFTGALARKIGRFELADGATLFLDEIGELPLELQVKLLRIIQEGEFERLGSSKTLKVDVRIIAATNRNLKEQVNKGLFREDLWYRLNVFPITVPPLRHRRDDIPMLIEHFANTFSRKLGKEINSVAPATITALRNYAWPGNVRELANVIERAVINSHGPVLRVREQLTTSNGNNEPSLGRTLEEVEREYIVRVLEDRGWRIEGPHGAAHVLGMNPSTLRTRMAKLGISKSHQYAAGNGGN